MVYRNNGCRKKGTHVNPRPLLTERVKRRIAEIENNRIHSRGQWSCSVAAAEVQCFSRGTFSPTSSLIFSTRFQDREIGHNVYLVKRARVALPRFLNMLDSEDSCGELYAQRCRHERFYAQVFRTFA